MPALLAALIALALATPADAAPRRKRHARPPACLIQIWDPGTGPVCFGAPRLR